MGTVQAKWGGKLVWRSLAGVCRACPCSQQQDGLGHRYYHSPAHLSSSPRMIWRVPGGEHCATAPVLVSSSSNNKQAALLFGPQTAQPGLTRWKKKLFASGRFSESVNPLIRNPSEEMLPRPLKSGCAAVEGEACWGGARVWLRTRSALQHPTIRDL